MAKVSTSAVIRAIQSHLLRGSVNHSDSEIVLAGDIGYPVSDVRRALKKMVSDGDVESSNGCIRMTDEGRAKATFMPETEEGRRQQKYATTQVGHHIPGKLPDHWVSDVETTQIDPEEMKRRYFSDVPAIQKEVDEMDTKTDKSDNSSTLRKQEEQKRKRLSETLEIIKIMIEEWVRPEKIRVHEVVAQRLNVSENTASQYVNELQYLGIIEIARIKFQGPLLIISIQQDRSVSEFDIVWLQNRIGDVSGLKFEERIMILFSGARWLISTSDGKPVSLSGHFMKMGISKASARSYQRLLVLAGLVIPIRNHGCIGQVYERCADELSRDEIIARIRRARNMDRATSENSTPTSPVEEELSASSDGPVDRVSISREVYEELIRRARETEDLRSANEHLSMECQDLRNSLKTLEKRLANIASEEDLTNASVEDLLRLDS